MTRSAPNCGQLMRQTEDLPGGVPFCRFSISPSRSPLVSRRTMLCIACVRWRSFSRRSSVCSDKEKSFKIVCASAESLAWNVGCVLAASGL